MSKRKLGGGPVSFHNFYDAALMRTVQVATQDAQVTQAAQRTAQRTAQQNHFLRKEIQKLKETLRVERKMRADLELALKVVKDQVEIFYGFCTTLFGAVSPNAAALGTSAP